MNATCGGTESLIFACSGAADVGAIADGESPPDGTRVDQVVGAARRAMGR